MFLSPCKLQSSYCYNTNKIQNRLKLSHPLVTYHDLKVQILLFKAIKLIRTSELSKINCLKLFCV